MSNTRKATPRAGLLTSPEAQIKFMDLMEVQSEKDKEENIEVARALTKQQEVLAKERAEKRAQRQAMVYECLGLGNSGGEEFKQEEDEDTQNALEGKQETEKENKSKTQEDEMEVESIESPAPPVKTTPTHSSNKKSRITKKEKSADTHDAGRSVDDPNDYEKQIADILEMKPKKVKESAATELVLKLYNNKGSFDVLSDDAQKSLVTALGFKAAHQQKYAKKTLELHAKSALKKSADEEL